MSNWGTLYNELLLRAGGGRTSDNDKVLAKLAIVDAITRHDSRQFYFTEERFTFQTVADQETYGVADGVPQGIVRFLSPHLFVDRDQDEVSRYAIPRVTPAALDEARATSPVSAEPDLWSYFDRTLEIYPPPDAVHDVSGRAVVRPGVPIARNESGAWKFYKPWTTSFVGGNEMTDTYPDASASEANAWFTETLAYAVIRNYAMYILYSDPWQASKGQDSAALQRYAEFLSELEAVSAKVREPRKVEPMNLGALA